MQTTKNSVDLICLQVLVRVSTFTS